ncbi:hypothetical protein [Streptomyces canus]|uniref:hypothetical protein n=1 Tax=Streptomyces canus TaxID=58343 RepID=UPI00278A5402|nr:hypothetical protein [Streptomyces canus]MDQ0766897.1 hypothetical protein [Streptomyces canus]
MVELGWDGWLVPQIADELRWDLGGQAANEGSPRPNSPGSSDRSGRTSPAGSIQPSNDMWAPDEAGPAEWTLDALAADAQKLGIEVGRSQVRRIFLAQGSAGAAPAPGPGRGPRFRRKGTRIIELCTSPPCGATVVCADELGPVIPRTFQPGPGWSPDGHRIKKWVGLAGLCTSPPSPAVHDDQCGFPGQCRPPGLTAVQSLARRAVFS